MDTVLFNEAAVAKPRKRPMVSNDPFGVTPVEVAAVTGIMGLSQGYPLAPVFGEVSVYTTGETREGRWIKN